MALSRWRTPRASGYSLLPLLRMEGKVDDSEIGTHGTLPRDGEGNAVGVMNEATALPQGTLDPVYEAKARVLNKAIQDIGMGWVGCVPGPSLMDFTAL